MNQSKTADRRVAAPVAPRARDLKLCLIVHDDLDLRLRLAALVRQAVPTLDADSVSGAAFEGLTPERMNAYVAVLFIIEFHGARGDPLARVVRLRKQAQNLPLFVFARGGDERTAAHSIKAGALDYWPIHSVKLSELRTAMEPLVGVPMSAPLTDLVPEPVPASTIATASARVSAAAPAAASARVSAPAPASASARVSAPAPGPASVQVSAPAPAPASVRVSAPASVQVPLSTPTSAPLRARSRVSTPASAAKKAVPHPGQPQIAGYRLIKKLASSAAATVYLAHSDALAQRVALKVQTVADSQTVSAADRKRFIGECNMLSALNHRAVANVLDFGITDEYLFLALDYFPCGSLRERLKNPVSESDAVNYARQIGEALQVVHAAHIIHRDLKPSNVMLTDDNRLVLIDFGSAFASVLPGDRTRTDFSTGTPYYVCPEQIDGREPDARGDLYSLGIVLYEMLVGAVPFAGNDLAEIFAAHRGGAVPRLPVPLGRYQPIVDRLLAKAPNHRFSTARLFLDALNALDGTTSTHAPAISKGAFDS